MARLGVGQKPVVANHYRHMMAEDVQVWSRFLQGFGHRIKELWYDVHVGASMQGNELEDPMLSKVAAGVSRKRIDVVCRVGMLVWVVEIKPFANMVAVGQVLVYARLFMQEYSVAGEIYPVIVANDCDPDVISLCDALGVTLIVND